MPKGEFVKVQVREDEDWEGDEILDVIIVLERKEKLDAKRTIKLSRFVRDELAESDEEHFPMFKFVTKKRENWELQYHNELLLPTRRILEQDGAEPSQASLRRAVGTVYYALFHLGEDRSAFID